MKKHTIVIIVLIAAAVFAGVFVLIPQMASLSDYGKDGEAVFTVTDIETADYPGDGTVDRFVSSSKEKKDIIENKENYVFLTVYGEVENTSDKMINCIEIEYLSLAQDYNNVYFEKHMPDEYYRDFSVLSGKSQNYEFSAAVSKSSYEKMIADEALSADNVFVTVSCKTENTAR